MEEEVKKVSNKNLIIGIIVVAIIIIILFVPMMPVEATYSDTEPYEETETYTEPESYEREATYVVDDWNLEEKLGFLDFYVQSDVILRNTDKYDGTFEVVHELYDINGLFGRVKDSFYLGAGESHTSTATFDTSWGQDTKGTYHVNPPTVIDTRLVEKTRVVQKTRVVEKTKTVYKSIIEILIYG